MKTTSGRGFAIRAWRRMRWKYCAAVVGFARRMLPSAASWMKRSMRALECSGPEPFVAVRQEQREPGRLAPLRLPGDQELVDDHLCRVGEVAELRLPQDQALGRSRRVAVLEAEAGDLRERAVVDLEWRERSRQVLDRRVLEAGLLVVEDEVAVGEGAALGVLAGQADVRALGEERRVRERLRHGPTRSGPPRGSRSACRAASSACGGSRSRRGRGSAPRSGVRMRFSETAVSTSGDLVRSSSPVPTCVEVGSS